jgi:hypothetical protein
VITEQFVQLWPQHAPPPEGFSVSNRDTGPHTRHAMLIATDEQPAAEGAPAMTRKACLDAAAACVLQDRANAYGGPEDSFALIAALWATILHRKVTVSEVALCLSALKMARLIVNPAHADSWVDLAGYAACGAEVSAPKQGA